MTAEVRPVPEGYHTVTPYLIVHDAAGAIDFYKKAFGATELFRMSGPGGKIGHAEVKIGDSPVMLADEHPEMGARSPGSIGGSPISMLVYVEDVDTFFARAVAAGAKVVRPITNMFYGDRTGGLEDPYGYQWYISTHIEDVSMEELQRRAASAH
jgi:PhnB protein